MSRFNYFGMLCLCTAFLASCGSSGVNPGDDALVAGDTLSEVVDLDVEMTDNPGHFDVAIDVLPDIKEVVQNDTVVVPDVDEEVIEDIVEVGTDAIQDTADDVGDDTSDSSDVMDVSDVVIPAVPQVTILTPAVDACLTGTVEITATATDDKQVTRVAFFFNDVLICEDMTAPYSCLLNTDLYLSNTYSLKVVADDADMNHGEQDMWLTVDREDPWVTIDSPNQDQPIGGSTLPVVVRVADGCGIARVSFSLRDQNISQVLTSPPWEVSLDIADLPEATYYLDVMVTDKVGRTSIDSRTVILDCDFDDDGWFSTLCGGDDCVDTDGGIHPGQTDYCDGVDNDCVGGIDDNCVDDCAGLECGLSPNLALDCGTCGANRYCDAGQCAMVVVMLVPAGNFAMGCSAGIDTSCGEDEKPLHMVNLSAYSMDLTETTVATYQECVTAGECTEPLVSFPECNWRKGGREKYPMNCVNWEQADAYCAWAGKRLPTEAEWEKAVRGVDVRLYPWGNAAPTCDYAVMNETGTSGCGTGGSLQVCSKSPDGDSLYDICDMAGNVWEWTSDWYAFDYYAVSPGGDPTGPATGTNKVIRGGAYDTAIINPFRASFRNSVPPTFASPSNGFRCVVSE